MKTPLAAYRSFSVALLLLLAALVTGCATQPDRPPVIIEKDVPRAEGRQFTQCKPPKATGRLPDCRGLSGATVSEIKSVTILRGVVNPTCEVYFWEGWYWEFCW